MSVLAFIVASLLPLFGVGLGAVITHRLMKGLAPLPAVRVPRKAKAPEPKEPAFTLPDTKGKV